MHLAATELQWNYQTIKCEEDIDIHANPPHPSVAIDSRSCYFNQIKSCTAYTDKVVLLCRVKISERNSTLGCLVTFKSSPQGIDSFGSIRRLIFAANPVQLAKMACYSGKYLVVEQQSLSGTEALVTETDCEPTDSMRRHIYSKNKCLDCSVF